MNNYQRGYNTNRQNPRQTGYGYGQNCQNPQNSAPGCATNQSMQRSDSPDMCRPVSKPLTKGQLMNYLNEVSFAVTDITLYLDTHPDDQEALAYCEKYRKMRNAALKEYAKCYGPLTIDTIDDSFSDSWKWVTQPWPWEGGAC